MSNIKTPYGKISADTYEKLKKIKLLLSDVDGVLSDGNIYITENGDEIKTFNTKDGFGIKSIQSIGINFGVITGRYSKIVLNRMNSLGVKYIYQGISDKSLPLKELKKTLSLSSEEIAYIGDDIPDAKIFNEVGLSFCPKDAHPSVKYQSDYICHLKGGKGVVREVCDLLLQANKNIQSKCNESI
ncbi:MAG: 3-deoxy-manno-octulosonate-8-phosphatase KdsC [Succinivibrionaceae bacterium]